MSEEKIVIYTGAFGENYGIVPQKPIENVDFICFTDNEKKVPKPWKALVLKDNLSNHLKNRHPKLLPHHYFKEYDISIYIDSNFLIIGDIFQLIKKLGNFKLAIFDHNQTDDARNCIYEEYEAILELGKNQGVYKDDVKVMQKQINWFKEEGYPKNFGLIKGGVIIRRHNDESVIKLMEDWLKIVSTMSKRDQLSFNYVAWKNKFKYTTINGDLRTNNPYFYFLASARKSYVRRLLKYKLKKFFGIIKHPKP